MEFGYIYSRCSKNGCRFVIVYKEFPFHWHFWDFSRCCWGLAQIPSYFTCIPSVALPRVFLWLQIKWLPWEQTLTITDGP